MGGTKPCVPFVISTTRNVSLNFSSYISILICTVFSKTIAFPVYSPGYRRDSDLSGKMQNCTINTFTAILQKSAVVLIVMVFSVGYNELYIQMTERKNIYGRSGSPEYLSELDEM